MLFDGELCRHIPGDSVALFTRAALRPVGELAFVMVLMTITTGLEFQAALGFASRMAFVAGNYPVTSFQRITGFAVIESRLLRDLPPCRRMASLAPRSETPRVGILMAVAAILVSHIGKTRVLVIGRRTRIFDFLMTFGAGRRLVAAGQNELRPVMIEPRRR